MEGDFCETCAKDLVDNGLVAYSDAADIDLDTKQRKVAEPTVKEEVKAKEQPFVAL